MKLTGIAVAVAVASVLALSACSASGGTAGSSGGGSSSGSGSSGSSGSTAGAKISGDYTGTVVANNCISPGIMAIYAVINGTKYPGTISVREAGFLGPSAVAFATAPDKEPALPTVSSDGTTWTLSNVHVYDDIGGKSVVFDGTLTCP
jgi:hypothetical protein